MIHINGLKKYYNDFELDVTMEIPSGMIVGLIGKNGAGKSTVIKSILDLVHKDGGSIEIMGETYPTVEIRQKMGVALAESGFSEYLDRKSIEGILEALFPEFDKAYFRKYCEKLRIPEKKRLREYSTGMRAKLRVLIALSHKASMLILDEPTAGLDIEARNEILDMIRSYMVEDEKRSVLITSHIATDLENLCDTVYLIHDGKILLKEETDVILSDYGIIKADDTAYEKMTAEWGKNHILSEIKTPYGYECLTTQRKTLAENCPGMIIEPAGIDELIMKLAR